MLALVMQPQSYILGEVRAEPRLGLRIGRNKVDCSTCEYHTACDVSGRNGRNKVKGIFQQAENIANICNLNENVMEPLC